MHNGPAHSRTIYRSVLSHVHARPSLHDAQLYLIDPPDELHIANVAEIQQTRDDGDVARLSVEYYAANSDASESYLKVRMHPTTVQSALLTAFIIHREQNLMPTK